MIFTERELEYYRKRILATSSQQPPSQEKLDDLINFLEAKEKRFIDLINGRPLQSDVDSLEHALSRYILQNLHREILERNMASSSEQETMETLASALELENTLITPEVWEKIQQQSISFGGYVDGEGAIWRSFLKPFTYEQADLNWASALAYYAQLNRGDIQKSAFVVQTNISGIPVASNNIKIAIMGDWGSGPYQNADGLNPSTGIMENICKQNPDLTIHLGDVYYNGTSDSDSIFPAEEQRNLVDVWPLPDSQSFTLNSNHEMYPGGHGLFEVALTSPKFSLQNGASYFALVHKNWVVFGLDSAYYDNSQLFMDGALTDQAQLNFVKGIDTTGKKIVIMTHHTGLSVDGKTKMALWNNVNAALGGKDPDFWYWGHIHNAIAYSSHANLGSTIARCVGHGSLPFSKATSLYQADGSNNPEILYYAGQELPIQPYNGEIQLAKNGYVILTLTADSLTEVFYDLNGNEVWAPPIHNFA